MLSKAVEFEKQLNWIDALAEYKKADRYKKIFKLRSLFKGC